LSQLLIGAGEPRPYKRIPLGMHRSVEKMLQEK